MTRVPMPVYVVLGLLSSGYLIYLLGPILTPFLVAAMLAYLGDPLVRGLQRLKISRSWAAIWVFSLIILFLVLLALVGIPILHRQFVQLLANFPLLLESLEARWLPWLQQLVGDPDLALDLSAVKAQLTQYWQEVSQFAPNVLSLVSRSGLAVAGWLMNLILIPVVTFYLLRDWERVQEGIMQLLPKSWRGRVTLLGKECDEVISAFVRGQLLVMLALAVFYSVGLSLVGIKLALLLGLLAGLANIVPYLGFLLGIIAASVAAFFQFQSLPVLGCVWAVFLLGQLLEGMLLTPWLVGDRIGLHPVAVIFAVLAGGQLFGPVGVLLALPVAAVIMVLLRHIHDHFWSGHVERN